jgi:hypothetical protein
MRRRDPGKGSQHLESDIRQHLAPGQDALGGRRQGHSRVEMRTRDRTKNEDQHDQAAASRQTIGQESDGDIATCQTLTHDTGADHDRQQKGGAQTFGDEAAWQ